MCIRDRLIDDLYTEMAEFSFLTKYIFGTGIEEIDINSWRDIEIQYNDGRCEKLEEHFESPEHAVNVIRRMLHVSGMVLDNASPAVLGHLSKNIRIAVLKTPLVDEDVGIAASIRIVNPQSLKKENFVDGGTATGEMLDFLAECLRYGISICVAGATSSGKTTLAGWLLTTIPDGKRIFTIENGSRELALVREKDGKVTNSVIHTLTRYSENEKQNIDQDMLQMCIRDRHRADRTETVRQIMRKIGGKKYETYDEKSSTECKGSCRESRNVNEGYQGRELRGYGGQNPDRSRSRRTALGRSLCTLRGCGDAYPYPEDSGHVQLCRIRNTGPRQGNRKNNRMIWRKTDA